MEGGKSSRDSSLKISYPLEGRGVATQLKKKPGAGPKTSQIL